MIEPHEIAELTARLGQPQLEQITHRPGRPGRVHYYWGCGCCADGIPEDGAPTAAVRWSRCDHHVAAEELIA